MSFLQTLYKRRHELQCSHYWEGRSIAVSKRWNLANTQFWRNAKYMLQQEDKWLRIKIHILPRPKPKPKNITMDWTSESKKKKKDFSVLMKLIMDVVHPSEIIFLSYFHVAKLIFYYYFMLTRSKKPQSLSYCQSK